MHVIVKNSKKFVNIRLIDKTFFRIANSEEPDQIAPILLEQSQSAQSQSDLGLHYLCSSFCSISYEVFEFLEHLCHHMRFWYL